MSRTPIFRRLRALIARAEAARRLHVPVGALDEVRARSDLSRASASHAGVQRADVGRRDVVRAAGAAAALAALGPAAWAKPGKASAAPKLAIVGAGLAGLVAALRLRKKGIAVPIYEASSRAGGRVHTDWKNFAATGQRVERGGELIDTGHKRVRKLVKKLGLELDDLLAAEAPHTEPLAMFGGSAYSFDAAEDDFKHVYHALHQDVVHAGYPTTYDAYSAHAAELDALSISAWIESRVPGGLASQLGKLLEVAYDIEYGAPAGEQSALNLVYLLGFGAKPNKFALFGESDERFRVRGGNQLVTDRLAALLASQLRLRHRLVAAATLADGRTRLTFDTDAGTVEQVFDRVILALPFSILRASVDITALALQPKKQLAIAAQGMGINAKVHVQFVDRHWIALGSNGECFGDTGFQNTWEETRAQPGAQGILVNFFGSGSPSIAGLPSEGAAEQFLPQIEPLLPGITGKWNGVASIDDWPTSPYQLGSYAYWRVGQYTSFAGVEREVEGRVHFAGEHTSIDFQGFMEGAVESGERAAAEVLAAL
jgi:monoamine oxidase